MDRQLMATQEAIEEIWDIAKGFGLDPFPIHFEIVPATQMYEIGAYGIPGRFSHWTNGKAYHQLKTRYDYGLSKIYELVINTDPCYAFLMESNSLLQNKLVIAHVIAHCDFFKNNAYFGSTNRQMVETASVSADRIRQYEFMHGKLEVEKFLDAVLSIQWHVHGNDFIKRKIEDDKKDKKAPETPYDDLFNLGVKEGPEEQKKVTKKIPPEPESDLLLFFAENAPNLEDWQRDIIDVVRAEALYFVPQMRTKIVNEGWASFWHARILRELSLTDEEAVEFAKLHSGVLSPSKMDLNPYFVGMKMLEDIENRWNEPTEEERKKFGRSGNQGRAKIFDVRSVEDDASFIRNFLTKKLVEELDLYIYKREGDELLVMEKDWEKIRKVMIEMVARRVPSIEIVDADFRGASWLYLEHRFEDDGVELDMTYAMRTMEMIYLIWGRNVNLKAVVNGVPTLTWYDGKKFEQKRL
ncbi:MAG: SpoVR family protein [Patescibacteria group bacterium]|nr:SpoVR family protein [Patescibacteria group bacterium]